MHGSCTIAVVDTAVVQRRISAQVCTGSPAAGATFTFQPHVCRIKSHSYGRQDCTAACGKAGTSVNISAVAKWRDAWLRQCAVLQRRQCAEFLNVPCCSMRRKAPQH
ncbi:unnamed protein product [Symbiodinium natans]|uniref:Uncharacterized protein n=1 Tax=Symbiodinium natans TaxID=878477 RepID=A0A812RKD4_9DINO|nr:unnamed protein product [Symbiodinium natans]